MEKKRYKPEDKCIGTRYPSEILEAMKEIAEMHGRSFNAEVVWALRQYIVEVKGEDPLAKPKLTNS